MNGGIYTILLPLVFVLVQVKLAIPPMCGGPLAREEPAESFLRELRRISSPTQATLPAEVT